MRGAPWLAVVIGASAVSATSAVDNSAGPVPTAIRKMRPCADDKFLQQYVAFGPAVAEGNATRPAPPYRPVQPYLRPRSFGIGLRQACPANMLGCAAAGGADKCCPAGSYCSAVSDQSAGGVACCQNGAYCQGAVAGCPADAVSCSADLGGGCCIAGFVCFGVGCVPSPAPSPTYYAATTLTSTLTSVVVGAAEPSTVVITIVTTITPSLSLASSKTITTIQTVTDSSAANPPFRLTLSSIDSGKGSMPGPAPTGSGSVSPYCPVGFYGCLAQHGGGCCRTERDCATSSCPPTPYTTIIAGPLVTMAVPVSDVRTAIPADSCAASWFLCGSDAGPIPGCCPSGYSCGTASCTASSSSAVLQKEFPSRSAKGPARRLATVGAALVSLAAAALVLI